ncbi:MAG: hypothetical protein A4E58_00362 [Syntrophorhabdus sp. PtaB.Bin006]|nr:MAG: hypothetical protein A4E58_00362 [Syntrophorhabdus sp. PtaB.Bin006]
MENSQCLNPLLYGRCTRLEDLPYFLIGSGYGESYLDIRGPLQYFNISQDQGGFCLDCDRPPGLNKDFKASPNNLLIFPVANWIARYQKESLFAVCYRFLASLLPSLQPCGEGVSDQPLASLLFRMASTCFCHTSTEAWMARPKYEARSSLKALIFLQAIAYW